MSQVHADDDAEEEAWCAAQRAHVVAYLGTQGVVHGEIGEWPAWHVVPIVALWVVESLDRPGWIGWWAISGDLPTDYISASALTAPQHPRKALDVIATAWLAQATAATSSFAANRVHTGSIALTEESAQMLTSRAELLLQWSADDALWDDA